MSLTVPGPVWLLTRRLAADRFVSALNLSANVSVQVAGEAENIAHNLVGNDVSEEATQVGENAGMSH